ncbi:MAG: hypothetical protein Q9169_004920 [Polycauliona sp. 2 TL-2023]
MGRPKNGERRKARQPDVVPPSDFNDAFKAPSPLRHDQYPFEPTSQAASNIADHPLVAKPASLVDQAFLQDFSYHDTDWVPTTLVHGQQLVSSAPYRPFPTSNALEPTFPERNLYHNSPENLSHTDFAMAGIFQHDPMAPSRAQTLSPPPNSCNKTRHPSLDIFTRLSNVQIELWKRKERAKKISEQQEPPSSAEFDDFIQTTSDLCGIAKTAAALNHSMATPETTSYDMECFYFQLMMSVSAALDILSHLETPTPLDTPNGSESKRHTRHNTPSSNVNLVRKQSSFFALSSLDDSEHLNKILTLTTLDHYLSQIMAVLSSIDMTTRIGGLHQGIEDVVGRSQHVRQLILSSLHELRAG